MKRGLLISIAAHAIILSWGFVVLSKPMQFDATESEALPVTLVPISDTTSVKQGELTASQEEKAAVKPTTKAEDKPEAKNVGEGTVDSRAPLMPKEKPRNIDTSKTTAGAETAEALPSHDQKMKEQATTPPAEQQKLKDNKKEADTAAKSDDAADPHEEEKPADKPAEEKAADKQVSLPDTIPLPSQKPIEPHPLNKSEEKTTTSATKGEKTDDVDQLIKEALLVDKTKTQGGGAKKSSAPAGFGATKNIGSDDDLGQSFANLIATCVQSKFNIVALGGGTQSDLKIKAHFYLRNDGNLDGAPDITASGGDSRQQEVGVNQARAALISCAPFPLPADKFGIWHEIDMIFDPYQVISR